MENKIFPQHCTKQQPCLIGDIHPPEIVHVSQMKVGNIWTHK